MLIAITCVVAGGALILGFLQKKSFDNNTKDYQAKSANLRKIKSMAGYPSQETVDKMSSSLVDYEATLDGLSKEFAKVTIPEFKNVTPAEFAAKVSQATKNLKELYEQKEVALPADWYLGFEKYTSVPAPKEATGILLYNLEALVWLHEQLLEYNPDAILNLYRKPVGLEVEGGESVSSNKSSNKKKDKRNVIKLPIELTFAADEEDVRSFINAISKSEKYVFTIDTVKLKQIQVADSLTESSDDEPENNESASADGFNNLFEEDNGEEEEVVLSNEKLFTQVLGKERVAVFLDLNLTYLPEPIQIAKK